MAEAAEILLQNPTALELLSNPQLLIRERCRRSLWFTTQYFWHTIIHDELIPNWHMPYLCHELQLIVERAAAGLPKLYDLIINIPPGTTKSTISVQMLPIWAWLRFHHLRFIFGSYSGDLALEHAGYSRDIIDHLSFKELFPEYRVRSDRDTKSLFQIQYYNPVTQGWENGGTRAATSVGGTITGKHAHVIGIDDPLNPKQAASEVLLKTAERWMSQTLSTRKVDKAITPTILIMQRLHQADPSGIWLEKMKDKSKKRIKWICLPGEIEEYGDQLHPKHLGQYYKNNLLDAKRMNWQVLHDMKAELGQYGYAGQIGQNPTPPGGGMFRVDQIEIINNIPEQKIIQAVRYWDKAGTTTEENAKASFTCGAKLGRIDNGYGNVEYVILDIQRDRWATDARERTMRQTAQIDGHNIVQYVEQEPGSGGKDSAYQSVTKTFAGYPAEADKPTGDKTYRADPFSVQVNWGCVKMVRGDWNRHVLDELRMYPNSVYKDITDALSGAYKKIALGSKAGVW